MTKKIISVFLVSICFASASFGFEARVEDKIANADQLIREKGAKYGKKNVLVVFDLDNTLLAMDQEFGSNEWFDWQSAALKQTDPKKKQDQEFQSFDDLLAFQTLLMTVYHMHPVEASAPDVVDHLQKDGFGVIVETSRGQDLISATLREIKRNKMDFEISEIGEGFPQSYLPVTERQKNSLTDAEITSMKLLPARPVIYFEGVYFTSGQHKGAMLRALLDKLKLRFKAIILVDDTKRHCDAMQAAFKDSKTDLTTIEYTAKLSEVTAFEKSDKKIEKKKFKILHDAVESVQK